MSDSKSEGVLPGDIETLEAVELELLALEGARGEALTGGRDRADSETASEPPAVAVRYSHLLEQQAQLYAALTGDNQDRLAP